MILAENGADVLVNTRNEETLEAVYQDVKKVATGKVAKYLADVGYEDQVNAMFDHAIAEFGKVNILINNAAVNKNRPVLEYTSDFFEENLRVNLYAVFYTSTRAAREMVKRGVKGSIVNFSSIGARQPHRQMLAYDTAKGAIESMTKAMALELAPFDITVNAISPASIVGNFVRQMDPEIQKRRDPRDFVTPITRQGTPEDVANLVLFLSSEESSFITGQVVAIDGGLSAQARPAMIAPVEITPLNIAEYDIR
jgi:3-oxoacyl-[acyl-carrier protein] reductase